MKFTIDHFNINVLDLDKSLAFYDKALGLKEARRKKAYDGSFIIVYLEDGISTNKLELTWLKSRTTPYDLGDEEFHIAFKTNDFDVAHAHHKQMGCICYETRRWASISSVIRTDTGWKSYPTDECLFSDTSSGTLTSLMFIPTTMAEVTALGWDRLDIVLVTGDTYIDSPFMGVSLIGKILLKDGFRVGIIAQPALDTPEDILRLGTPALFWGVTGGAVDSMVANYTPLKKRRKTDDYTPGYVNNRRPDRAVIAYANLIRRFCKPTPPIVLGGIEASLRRTAHYDFWSNKIRRSILFDAKGDFLVFGMGHIPIRLLAKALKNKKTIEDIAGIAYIAQTKKGLALPSFETITKSQKAYVQAFHTFYQNTDPLTAQGLCQAHNDRYLILNPPAPASTTPDMDEIHDLAYEHDVHPFYKAMGPVRALDTIRFAIPTHYGCYGECRFCAITIHQGRTVQCRSMDSIVRQAKQFTTYPDFKGNIMDLAAPQPTCTDLNAKKNNQRGLPGQRVSVSRSMQRPAPQPFPVPGSAEKTGRPGRYQKVFITSGIRYDLILKDKRHGMAFLEKLVKDHVSGQLKSHRNIVSHMFLTTWANRPWMT